MQAADLQEKIKQMNDQMNAMQQSASAGGQPTGNITNITTTGGSNSAGGVATNANANANANANKSGGQQQAPLVSQLLQLNSNSFGGNANMFNLNTLTSPTIPTPRTLGNPYQLPPTPLPALTPAASATTPRTASAFDTAAVSSGLSMTMQQIVASQNSSSPEKNNGTASASSPKAGGTNNTVAGGLPSTGFNSTTVSGASLDLTGTGLSNMAGFNGLTSLGQGTSTDAMNQILLGSTPNNGFLSTPRRNKGADNTTNTTIDSKLPKLPPTSGTKKGAITPTATNLTANPSIGSLMSFRGLSDPLAGMNAASGIPRLDSANGLFLSNAASLNRDSSVPTTPHLNRGISELSLMSQGNSNFVPYPVNGYFEPPTPGKVGDATPNIQTPSFQFNAQNTKSAFEIPASAAANATNANSDKKDGDSKKKEDEEEDSKGTGAANTNINGDGKKSKKSKGDSNTHNEATLMAEGKIITAANTHNLSGGRTKKGTKLKLDLNAETSDQLIDENGIITPNLMNLNSLGVGAGPSSSPMLGTNGMNSGSGSGAGTGTATGNMESIVRGMGGMNSMMGPLSMGSVSNMSVPNGMSGMGSMSGMGNMASMGGMGSMSGMGGMGSMATSMMSAMNSGVGGMGGMSGMGGMMGGMSGMGGMGMSGYGMSMPQQAYGMGGMSGMSGMGSMSGMSGMGSMSGMSGMGGMSGGYGNNSSSNYMGMGPMSSMSGMGGNYGNMGMGMGSGGNGGNGRNNMSNDRGTLGSPAQSQQWNPNGHGNMSGSGMGAMGMGGGYGNNGRDYGYGVGMGSPTRGQGQGGGGRGGGGGGGGGNQGAYQQYGTNAQGNQVPVPRYRSNRGFSASERNRFGRGGNVDNTPPSLQDIANMDPRQLTRSNISLSQLVEAQVIEKLARDQNGSRFIQQRLETASLNDKEGVFRQIQRNALALCEDVFGNYVIQKFFEHGTDTHRLELAQIIRGRVLPLTKSMYGCRVIQKAFEYVHDHLKITLVSELKDHVEDCVRDQNGNHVIQKVIAEVPSHHISFIVDTFKGKVYHFSTHPYGCRVIQRLLEHCDESQKEPLLNELIGSILALSKDSYGNYVVQHVLKHGPDQARNRIIREVANNVLAMSKHKFSSNVVEKCFMFGNDEERDGLLDKVIGTTQENSPMVQMVRDQYGNYVIQKLLEVTNVAQRTRLISNVTEMVPNLRKLMFGKHIIAKIEKITGKQLQ